MNIIEAMKKYLSLEESVIDGYRADLEYIDQFLRKNKIWIPESFEAPFLNHILMLLQRLTKNDCASLENQEMIEEIDEFHLVLAKRMLQPLFEKYAVKPNRIEEALIAIYLQAAECM